MKSKQISLHLLLLPPHLLPRNALVLNFKHDFYFTGPLLQVCLEHVFPFHPPPERKPFMSTLTNQQGPGRGKKHKVMYFAPSGQLCICLLQKAICLRVLCGSGSSLGGSGLCQSSWKRQHGDPKIKNCTLVASVFTSNRSMWPTRRKHTHP